MNMKPKYAYDSREAAKADIDLAQRWFRAEIEDCLAGLDPKLAAHFSHADWRVIVDRHQTDRSNWNRQGRYALWLGIAFDPKGGSYGRWRETRFALRADGSLHRERLAECVWGLCHHHEAEAERKEVSAYNLRLLQKAGLTGDILGKLEADNWRKGVFRLRYNEGAIRYDNSLSIDQALPIYRALEKARWQLVEDLAPFDPDAARALEKARQRIEYLVPCDPDDVQ